MAIRLQIQISHITYPKILPSSPGMANRFDLVFQSQLINRGCIEKDCLGQVESNG